jgi:hypothetical protein
MTRAVLPRELGMGAKCLRKEEAREIQGRPLLGWPAGAFERAPQQSNNHIQLIGLQPAKVAGLFLENERFEEIKADFCR